MCGRYYTLQFIYTYSWCCAYANPFMYTKFWVTQMNTWSITLHVCVIRQFGMWGAAIRDWTPPRSGLTSVVIVVVFLVVRIGTLYMCILLPVSMCNILYLAWYIRTRAHTRACVYTIISLYMSVFIISLLVMYTRSRCRIKFGIQA